MSRSRIINRPKYWITALAFVMSRIFFSLFILSLGWAVIEKNINILWIALGFFSAIALLFIILLINRTDVICPLCRTPVFQALGGAQKAAARKRFGFALSMIRLNRRQKCIHCKEPFRWLNV